MFVMRFVFFGALLSLMPLRLLAVAMPGPELGVWQTMQGQWMRHCYLSTDGDTRVYRRDFLVVNFTALKLTTKIYSDSNCKRERTQYRALLKYAFTGSYFYTDAAKGRAQLGYDKGKKIFALNVMPESALPAILSIPSLNIISIQSGKLYFGRDYSGQPEKGERLTHLDIKNPFIRH